MSDPTQQADEAVQLGRDISNLADMIDGHFFGPNCGFMRNVKEQLRQTLPQIQTFVARERARAEKEPG